MRLAVRARLRVGRALDALLGGRVALRLARVLIGHTLGLLGRNQLLLRGRARLLGGGDGGLLALDGLDGLGRLQHVSLVALLDIDHFKSINDSFGHESGDAVLRQVAEALAGAIRPTDVVGRWGGEEFVVAAKGLNSELAGELVERLRSAVTAADVTASVGWTLWDPTNESWAEALDRADVALYGAKESGRNQAIFG